MRVVSADFTVLLPIESGLLSDAQIAAMQNATAGFVDQDVAIASGILEDVTVGVMWQRVVDVSNVTTVVATTNATNNGTLRELSSGQSEFALKQALAIDFTVLTMYIGSDNDFDLYAALDAEFQDPASRWFVWLSAADVVFEPLAPEPTPEEKAASAAKSELDSQSGSGASNGTVALVSLLAVAALALGIAASVFSVRQYKRNGGYGQELGSPRLSATSSGLGSRIANENIEYHNKQLELDARTDKSKKTKGEVEKQVEEVEVDSATSSWMNPPTSPNSLENGSTVAFDQIMQNKPRFTEPVEDRWSHIQPSNSGNHRATKDPPSAESEINFSTATQTHADPRNMSSLFDNNVSNVGYFRFAETILFRTAHPRITPHLLTHLSPTDRDVRNDSKPCSQRGEP